MVYNTKAGSTGPSVYDKEQKTRLRQCYSGVPDLHHMIEGGMVRVLEKAVQNVTTSI
jgi:hypothetical protein